MEIQNKSNYNLSFRICASFLIILHLVAFGPMRDVFAFSAQSASYRLNSGTPNEGGGDRVSASYKLYQDSIGEACAGRSQSASYILYAGYTPTTLSNPPEQTQTIPNQSWQENESLIDALDLDDYFTSDVGALNYTVSGNTNIIVDIAFETKLVSFSQPVAWHGTEDVRFIATDSEGNSTQSNIVSLQVQDVQNAPVLDFIPDVSAQETELVEIIPNSTDLDGDTITYTFDPPLDANGRWQTDYDSAGTYNVTVTATDTTELSDSQEVIVHIMNKNRPPLLSPISDITVDEGDLVTITPVATDPDDDAITFYYSEPLDSDGTWLTGYSDAGSYPAIVTASDGVDTVEEAFQIIVNDKNQAPQLTLTLSEYTVNPNDIFNIILTASDPDGDTMTFSVEKDGVEIDSGSITTTYITQTSFSNPGDHTISATVTDSNNASTTDSRGVDVVDPNADRNAINPVMGDFNGDALSDLGLHNSDNGTWEVCISDEGVFNNAVDWTTGFGTSKDWLPVGGDFNGDGLTDVGIYNNTNGELEIAISTGTSFSASSIGMDVSFASTSWQPFTGNFNGDKYSDFGLYKKDSGEVRIALGTGTGFGAFNTWIENFGNDYVALGGDFNGDSLTDLCLFKKSSGEFKVAFSNTMAFVDDSSWISGFAQDKDGLVADFNNDGLTDIGYWDKDNYKWYYAISTGDTFIDKGLWLDNFGNSDDESVSTGDFNGDGITDAATFDRDQIGINRWTASVSTDQRTDLLVEIDNGIGGKTQVTYDYASKFANQLLPFPVYVASSISTIDTLPVSQPQEVYTQNITYYGGYYDANEREFRGFARIRVTDPITNNYTETYFYQGTAEQGGALKGKAEKVVAFDGYGQQISETLNTYEVRKAGPEDSFLGFPALTEQTSTIWEENATFVTTRSKITYDSIGNVIEQVEEGDISVTGDEKSSVSTYAQAYEVGFNRPLEGVLKDKDGNIVSKKSFVEYDNKGNLLREEVWLYNPLTQAEDSIPTTYSYDSFGNLTTTVNVLGGAITTDYESTFYAYPQSITNSLGHTIQYVYEPKFGIVKSVTDANGATTTTTYDSLGRVTQVKNALNQITTTYSYPDFNTKITTQSNLTKTEYIDGLGRKYKAISSGEDGAFSRDVSTEVTYNNRGLVDSESLPHYVDEAANQISYITYDYDIRGRAKKTTSDFPGTLKDAYSTVNYIEPLITEIIDPEGNRKGSRKDVYGNILEVKEFTSGGVYTTLYEYDTQGNLVKTTDTQGNITQIFYDSLGRKLKMIDPDMGTWEYEYDLLGNLIKQTDAKGQVLEFQYDAINRLIEKKGLSPQGTVPEVLVTYEYDDGIKQYCVGRLSKITDQSGSTEFFYDKLGREVKSIKGLSPQGTVPEFFVVERTYDTLDRLETLEYLDGEIVTYNYDTNSGLLESVEGLSPQGTVPYVEDITYKANGQIRVIQNGNGTQTNYTYGQDLRLSRILTQGSSGTLQDLNYIFDKNGNVTTLTDNLRSNIRTYIYDDLDRLTEAQNVPDPAGGYTNFYYQYNSIGNMTYKSDIGVMTYGQNAGPHALTSAGGYSYQYDANGNMTVGKNKTMDYDVENRLIEVNQSGTITTFVYDGDGGRVKKIAASETTTYIGSLFEIDSSGKTTKHIFAGSNRVCSVESTGNTYYYHSDHLGSSNIITNQSGIQVQHVEYAPYGALARNEGTDAVPYKFTGKELDNTGLYFYGARYYDPEIGRFITADTIVQAPYNPQTLNRYTYCGNNPINYVDPSGHFFFAAIVAIFKAVAAFAAAHPVIVAAGAALNVAMNASNIHGFSDFISYAAIGAAAAAVGGGIGIGIGEASAFWGTVSGGFTAGFVGAAGNAGYQGASFSQALAFGAKAGGIAAATAVLVYGAFKLGEKAISSVEEASAARAKAVGVKTPVGEQGNGLANNALETDVGEVLAETQIDAVTDSNPLGVYRDPTISGIYANDPVIKTFQDLEFNPFVSLNDAGKATPLGGIFKSIGTGEAFAGSQKILVFGIKGTTKPTSWIAQVYSVVDHTPSTRWAIYGWKSVSEVRAVNLSLTEKAIQHFSK